MKAATVHHDDPWLDFDARRSASGSHGLRRRGRSWCGLIGSATGWGRVSGLLSILCLLALPPLAAANFTASVNPSAISMGESATLSLSFEGGQPDDVPQVPEPRGLRIQYTGTSQSYRIANGQTSSSVSFNYLVSPTAAGEFTIPALRVVVGNTALVSQPVKLVVRNAGDNGGAGGSEGAANQYAFLKLIVPKNEVYLGEVIQVETRLYVISGQDLQMQPLAADGFVLGKSVQVPQAQVVVGGNAYQTIGLRTTAAATKIGQLQLGPAECSLNLRISVARRRTGDPWQDFFADPFGPRAQLRHVNLQSETQSIRVLPLPREHVPATFTGAVGSYALEVTATPTNVALGDPITLRIRIAGRGALDSITLPTLDWRDFRVYPPTSKVELTDDLGLEGAKVFDQVVVAQNTEVKELPMFAFSFFDPVQKDYRTLSRAALPLIVRPAGSTQPLALTTNQAGAGELPANPQDIVDVKSRLGTVAAIQPPLVYQPWFLWVQGLPAIAWASVLIWRKRLEHLANNPHVVRRQAVARTVRQGLVQLPQLAAANDGPAFFALVTHLLQQQIGERLDLPAASITEAVVEEQLKPRQASAALLSQLHELFQTCNQARFAPASSTGELRTLVPKVQAVLEELQNLPT